jgi:hypothetical protein
MNTSFSVVRRGALLVLLAAMVSPLSAQRMTVTDRKAAPVVVESAVIHTEVTGRHHV